MSMTDSSGGSPQGSADLPGAVATSESWATESFSSGYPSSFGDPAGNQETGSQEHWSGRMPPQDSDAEQSVLGSMLISKDAIADVNEQIGGGDFYRPAHEMIYDTIVDLYGRGEPADPVTVSAELHRRGELQKVGGAPYLHTLSASVPIAANAGYYATIVREKAILRRLVDAGTKIAQMGYAGEGDVDQTVDVAQQEIYSIGEKRQQEDYAPLSSIMETTLDEIEAISNKDGNGGGVPTGFADLDDLTNGFSGGQMIIVAARPAVGKALALETRLPTPTGWTTMGEVKVGDQLIDRAGRPTTILAATEVLTGRPCYELTFSDGQRIVADGQHQWVTETREARRGRAEPEQVVTTEQMVATLTVGSDNRANHAVRNARLIVGRVTALPVEPYTLGAWLGDGSTDSTRLTSETPEIPMRIEAEGYVVVSRGRYVYSIGLPKAAPATGPRECEVCGADYVPKNSHVRTCGRSCGGRVAPRPLSGCPDCGVPYAGGPLCRSCYLDHGSMTALLRKTGVLGSKHVPLQYLRASEEQRRALLAGLLDTDGTIAGDGGVVQIALTNERLAEGVFELIVSLGYKCSWRTKPVRGRTEASSTCHILTFATHDQVFRLARKVISHKTRCTGPLTKSRLRYVTGVRQVDSVPVRCVQVDNEEHLYLAGRSMIPTHNSTLALDFCRSASIHNNLTSVIFSLEMSKSEITMRLLSAEAKIPLHNMRKGEMADEDWNKLGPKMGQVSGAPMFIDDSPNMTMMEIRAKARRLKQRHDLRLIVIDYLQLMSSGKKVESRQVEVSEFSRQIKLLAKELDVPIVALSQLNRGSEQRSDKRPMMSDLRESGCLTADTRLLRADTNAEVTMGELMQSRETDVPVWALDDRLRLVPRTLTHAFSSGVKKVYELTLASGRTVTATANHPFLTYEGWMPLSELVEGARIGSIRHVPPPLNIKSWDDDEVVLLAHLIGDGSFVKRQPIRYASVDEENLNTVAWCARNRFGISAVRDDYPAARVTTLRLPAPYRLARGRRNPIAAWLDGLGLFGLRSHEKFVPQGVFGLPKEQVGLFLRNLWATDGCVHEGKDGQATVYYASTSRRLVDEVAGLLGRFNVFSRIKTVRKAGYRPGYQLFIYGAANQLRFLEDIGVHGARGQIADRLIPRLRALKPNTNADTVPHQVWDEVRDVLQDQGMTHREFAAAMGTQFSGSAMWRRSPSRERLGRVAEVLGSAELEVMATNDVFWDEVASITPLGKQEVYDATVLGVHNFVANGIPAHNSIEQDADIVMLLHREDVYEKESPRAGEADIIVAKHRNGPTRDVVVSFQGHYSRFVDMAH